VTRAPKRRTGTDSAGPSPAAVAAERRGWLSLAAITVVVFGIVFSLPTWCASHAAVPMTAADSAYRPADECTYRYGLAKTAADSDIVDLVDVGAGKVVERCGTLHRDVRGPGTPGP
jgi:hypothetical protein